MYVQFMSGIDFNTPSWDLFIFLFFIVAIFVYGFTLGRSRIILLLLSTYMALALVYVASLPGNLLSTGGTQSLTIGSSPFFIVQITLFVAATLLIFFFVSGSALRRALSTDDVQGKAWQIVLFSILHAGFLIAAILSFLPEAQRTGLLTATRNLFASNTALFVWTLAPIVAMMFVKDPDDDH